MSSIRFLYFTILPVLIVLNKCLPFFWARMTNSFHELCLLPLFNTEIFSAFQDLLAMHFTLLLVPWRFVNIPSCKFQEPLKIPSKFLQNLGCKVFVFLRNYAQISFERLFWWMLRKGLNSLQIISEKGFRIKHTVLKAFFYCCHEVQYHNSTQ